VARDGDEQEEEWLPVLLPAYAAARKRHAAARAEAYAVTHMEAMKSISGPELQIRDADARGAQARTSRGSAPRPHHRAGGWSRTELWLGGRCPKAAFANPRSQPAGLLSTPRISGRLEG
jgi:hypothetical protein